MKLRKHLRHCGLCGNYYRTTGEIGEHLSKKHNLSFCPCDRDRYSSMLAGNTIMMRKGEMTTHFEALIRDGDDPWSHLRFHLIGIGS